MGLSDQGSPNFNYADAKLDNAEGFQGSDKNI